MITTGILLPTHDGVHRPSVRLDQICPELHLPGEGGQHLRGQLISGADAGCRLESTPYPQERWVQGTGGERWVLRLWGLGVQASPQLSQVGWSYLFSHGGPE